MAHGGMETALAARSASIGCTGAKSLFTSVLMRTLYDCASSDYIVRREAMDYVMGNGEDFRAVCGLTGIHPDDVIRCALTARDNPELNGKKYWRRGP